MISPSKAHLWGIDLGGTKIEGVILDPESPKEALYRLRVPTEAAFGYDHILTQIASLVAQLERVSGSSRASSIGIGTPGITIPSSGHLKNSNTLCLNGRLLAKDLERVLGCRVVLANDANCCALAEAILGAGRCQKTVFGIILGTGVGGGIVVDGEVLTGRHGICGEWGHNPLQGVVPPCYCGRRGCLETVCSGPALERFYTSLGGESISLREISVRADQREEKAAATITRLRVKFAEALGAVVNLLDPDAVVIGGGVGNIDTLYSQETRDAVCSHLFNDRFDTPLLRPQLGDSAGVFGAAMLTLSISPS